MTAIVLAVMAPALSHAFPGHPGQHSIEAEMCSAAGMGMTHQIVLDEVPLSSQHAAPFEHCPFCGQNGPGAVALPADPFRLPVRGSASLVPHLFQQSPTPLFAWTAAQPRGPPAA